MWRLNNKLLNNYWVKQEIKGELKKYLKTNENENMTHQNLTLHIKELEKEEQMKPKVSRRKEMIKIQREMKYTLKRK